MEEWSESEEKMRSGDIRIYYLKTFSSFGRAPDISAQTTLLSCPYLCFHQNTVFAFLPRRAYLPILENSVLKSAG